MTRDLAAIVDYQNRRILDLLRQNHELQRESGFKDEEIARLKQKADGYEAALMSVARSSAD